MTGLGYAATRSGFRAKFGVQGVLGTTMDMFAMEELPGGVLAKQGLKRVARRPYEKSPLLKQLVQAMHGRRNGPVRPAMPKVK